MIKRLFDSFLSLLEDGVATVIGFDFRPEGVNMKFIAQFGSTTDTNGFLKKLKPHRFAEIGTLPGGQLSYSASNFDPSSSKTLAAMMKESAPDDEDEDAKKAIDKAMDELKENGRTIELTASNITNGLEVSEFKDGAKAVGSMLKMFKAMTKTASYESVPLKSKPEITENAETAGDFKLTKVKLEFDFDKAVEKLPENTREAAKATMMRIAGEKTNVWIGASGKKVIHVTAKDWKGAKALIEEYLDAKNPLEKDESFATTRKQLPDEATILLAADSARFLQFMYDLVKDQIPGGLPGLPGGALPELKAPMGKPSYFGMAVVMKAEYVSFGLFVPATAVAQVRKMLSNLIDADN